jgi:hypothetical protein
MIYRPLFGALFLALLGALVTDRSHAQAQPDIEALTAELIGSPVFTAEGKEVGQLSDFSMLDGRVVRIRVTIGTSVGRGARNVEFRGSAFTVLRGAVVLDLSAEALDSLLINRDDKAKDK